MSLLRRRRLLGCSVGDLRLRRWGILDKRIVDRIIVQDIAAEAEHRWLALLQIRALHKRSIWAR